MIYKGMMEIIESVKEILDKGITFIDGLKEEQFLSYAELHKRSLCVLATLQRKGITRGDELIFQIKENQEFIEIFWACIMGGITAVPVSVGNNDEHRLKFFKIWEILNNPYLITDKKTIDDLENYSLKKDINDKFKAVKKNTIVTEDGLTDGNKGEKANADKNTIAFIQFSSGSTGDPKGVVLTHENLMINIDAMIKGAAITAEDRLLSWMPLTHDMGLIAIHLTGMRAKAGEYIIPTPKFVVSPTLWLEKASEHKATMLFSPNFGYKHLLKFISDEREINWDLSKIRLIYNGAEPISHTLIDEFMNKLENFGLNKNSMFTVYGLAEATVGVSFPEIGKDVVIYHLDRNKIGIGDYISEKDEESINTISFVEVGKSINECFVRIGDGNGNVYEDKRIGLIEIKGKNVTSGYYNNKEATDKVLSGEGWLNTGDLGFMVNGNVIITGRAKDIIFVNGQNFYSHDIERVAEEVEGVELGRAAAAGIFNTKIGKEEILLFILFKKKSHEFLELGERLKEHIFKKMGIEFSQIIPVKKVPKTTSGKIQRYKLAAEYENGEYNKIIEEMKSHEDTKRLSRNVEECVTEVEKKAAEIAAEILKVEKIGRNFSFFEMGGNSLQLSEFVHRINSEFKTLITVSDIYDLESIEKIGEWIEKSPKTEKRVEIKHLEMEYYPLASVQKRIYILSRLNKESLAYNISAGFLIDGNIETEKCEESFRTILGRHRILRTNFISKDGVPYQFTGRAERFKLITAECKYEDIDLEINKIIKPFDIEKEILFRVAVIKITERNQSMLLIDMHHLVSDGISAAIIAKEFSEIYGGRELTEIENDYLDHAVWNKNKEASEGLKREEKYWVNKFEGEAPVLNLPLDYSRAEVQQHKGKLITFKIKKSSEEKIKKLSFRENSSLFMVLLAAYNVLLYKYTGQEDIVIGTPKSIRDSGIFRNCVGMFVNTLVMRNKIEGGMNFNTFLKEIKKNGLEVFKNENYQFDALIEKLNIKRDTSRNPLFDVMFTMQNIGELEINMDGKKGKRFDIDNGVSKVDLAMEAFETEDGIDIRLEYDSALFKEEKIINLGNHFMNIIESVTETPDILIRNIEMLSDDEKKILLETFNATEMVFNKESYVHRLFEDAAEQHDDKYAVEFGENRITYRDLNEKGNKIANMLIDRGIGSESIVPILLDRSIEMAAAILGVLKSGAAYLPLDPEYPENRINYMVEDSGAKLIISQENLKGKITKSEKAEYIDIYNCGYDKYSGENLNKNIKCSGRGYVIYTSGSTGNPKGVVLKHSNIINFIEGMKREIDFSEGKTMLSLTTISFDIFVLEFFIPLLSGMKIVIGGEELQRSGEAVAKAIKSKKIDMVQMTPSRLNLLTLAGSRIDFMNGLKEIIIGGEGFPSNMKEQLIKIKGAKIYNVYGPTETTVWSTVKEIGAGDITIGKPIANTQIYILNKDNMIQPCGIPGELCIGGEGVAEGYYNRDELTKERFIENKFGKNGKIYRTGDLAVWREDGEIEVIGRLDNQVKIRGYRIEIGEIESKIKESSLVKDAAVVAKEDNSKFKYLSAYVVTDYPEKIGKIKEDVSALLPAYMVPSYFNIIERLPMTPNGKIDRKVLLEYKENIVSEEVIINDDTHSKVEAIWKKVLRVAKIGSHDHYFDIGGHSLNLIELHGEIKKVFDTKLKEIDLFKFTTISSQSKFLEDEKKSGKITEKESKSKKKTLKEDVAVVGMSMRVPGANNFEEFLSNISNKVCSIKTFEKEEVIAAGADEKLMGNKNYVRAWGTVDGVDKFDPSFFGYNPREAEIIDPQQRVFLEECYKSLENAGYTPDKYDGMIGLFAGTGMNTYSDYAESDPEKLAVTYQQMISNDKDFLATRVAYKLNLKGAAVSVQTACSTSLVALHLACQSLKSGENDMALAGGVSIRMPQNLGYIYQEGMILSPDGMCRAFDASAKGTVGGNGAGVVVLKRLSDALKDNDTIYAVIKGSAINNDGEEKAGYTAPSIEGQQRVITKAIEQANIDPSTVTYIEAHGTGTNLGDPIEIEALTKGYGVTDKTGYCAIGSVKTNIGHLDSAAGISGFIKGVLSVYNRKLLPTLHYEKANPKIDFEASPFYVNTEVKEWDNGEIPLRAGISSFGIGGTNAHVIIEEPPRSEKINTEGNNPQAFIYSAKTKEALDELINKNVSYLKENREINLEDAAFTLQNGRKEFEHRKVITASNIDELIGKLERGEGKSEEFDDGARKVTFMFSGQGSQYIGMAKELYENSEVFRNEMNLCSEYLEKEFGYKLLEIIYPAVGKENEAEDRLNNTDITQPALFVIEYALGKLLIAAGIKPDYMIGHSVGEYCAAVLAGVMTIKEGLKLVGERGRLMQTLPYGDMVAVFLNEEESKKYITDGLSVGVINSKAITVLSGTKEAAQELREKLDKEGVMYRNVNTSHAFHSLMMEPILTKFEELVKQTELKVPTIPYISNVTGTWIKGEEAVSSSYWVKHLRGTVRFADGAEDLLKIKGNILIETGPGTTLANLIKTEAKREKQQAAISLIKHPKDGIRDMTYFMNAFGDIWLNGVSIEWNKLGYTKGKRRILPNYPFQKMTIWKDKETKKKYEEKREINKRNKINDWFYIPQWKRAPLVSSENEEYKNCLIFSDNNGIAEDVAELLSEKGVKVTTVHSGVYYEEENQKYTIDEGEHEDYRKLFKSLKEKDAMPDMILHMLNVTKEDKINLNESEKYENCGFYSILFIAQELSGINKKVKLISVSDGMESVTGEEELNPYKKLSAGIIKVAYQENKNLICMTIDIPKKTNAKDRISEKIIKEAESNMQDKTIAFRGGYRLRESYEKLNTEGLKNNEKKIETSIKEGGVYLITGGLGGIGLETGEYISRERKITIILNTSKEFPERENWEKRLATGSEDRINNVIRKIVNIEKNGSKVEVMTADISLSHETEEMINKITSKYGKINGIFHAAGRAGGGIIELKQRENISAVFEPKVKGTIALVELLKDREIDFILLFSSVTAIFGGVGQADYCAANMFLDTVAQKMRSEYGMNIMSINWDTWQETGMAVKSIDGNGEYLSMKSPHPILDGVKISGSERKYKSHFDMTKWVLNEHWILGKAIVPGTTYIEMARSAFEEISKGGWIVIEEVYFMAPLVINGEEKAEGYTILNKTGSKYEFSIVSKSADGLWHEHAKGIISEREKENEEKVDISALCDKCSVREIKNPDGAGYLGILKKEENSNLDEFVKFGERWNNVKLIRVGENEGFGEFELNEGLKGDYSKYYIHPAILDNAVAFLRLFKYNGVYLPLSYGKLTVKGDIRGKIYSYVKLSEDGVGRGDKGILNFDVSIINENGEEIINIEKFTMREIDINSLTISSEAAVNSKKYEKEKSEDYVTRLQRENIEEGIKTAEGMEVLGYILAAGEGQTAVSTYDFEYKAAKYELLKNGKDEELKEEIKEIKKLHPRPELKSAYSAPKSEIEKKIAAHWRDMLGIEDVGVFDDIFELGGHSLLLVQFHKDLKEIFDTDISVVDLYKYTTISTLAKYLNKGDKEEKPVFNAVNDRINKRKEMMKKKGKFDA